MNTATPTDCDPVAELAAAVNLGKKLATQARADLTAATPTLVDAIRHQSGQSTKIENLLWSCWSDTHPTTDSRGKSVSNSGVEQPFLVVDPRFECHAPIPYYSIIDFAPKL
jgi:hypothetical protein